MSIYSNELECDLSEKIYSELGVEELLKLVFAQKKQDIDLLPNVLERVGLFTFEDSEETYRLHIFPNYLGYDKLFIPKKFCGKLSMAHIVLIHIANMLGNVLKDKVMIDKVISGKYISKDEKFEYIFVGDDRDIIRVEFDYFMNIKGYLSDWI